MCCHIFQRNLKRDRERQMQRHQTGMQNLMKSRDKRLNRKLQKQYANRNNWQDRNRNQVRLHKVFLVELYALFLVLFGV
jgi:uncharacterized membrane protein YheB (UPF0754 family)